MFGRVPPPSPAAIAHGILIGAGVGAAVLLCSDNQDQYWPQVHHGSTAAAAPVSLLQRIFTLASNSNQFPGGRQQPAAPGHNHSSAGAGY